MLIITKTPPRKPGRYRPRQPGEPLRGGALRRPYASSNHRWGRRPCSCLGLLSAAPAIRGLSEVDPDHATAEAAS
jgi:hypothetical protein